MQTTLDSEAQKWFSVLPIEKNQIGQGSRTNS